MTQKQTDYDKAERSSYRDYETSELRSSLGMPNEWLAHKTGFRDGFKFAQEQIRKETQESPDQTEPISTQFCPSYDQNTPENEGLQAYLDPKISEKAQMRAYFAKAAMAALIPHYNNQYQRVAQIAVNFADALIRELNQPKQ